MNPSHTITIIATATLVAFSSSAVAQTDRFADAVVAYDPGTGFATDFSTGLGFTNEVAVLGAPSLETPGDFGGPITPFATPFLIEQLLSVGEGGHVILEFDPPIFDQPGNPFGLDFVLYGNAGFTITNGDFTGGGITDGSTFGHNTGETRVSVSADNTTFFTLDPTQSPIADGLFPPDAAGQPGLPPNPALEATQFADADLEAIRALYAGSAGGTGYDLQWAQAEDGTPVSLPSVRYVRIDVLSGRSELDAAAASIPLEATHQQRIHEDFSQDPLANGWQTTGDDTLFEWVEASEHLQVQWDSARPNSYFYLPLGQTLDTDTNFSIAFDLELESIAIGTTPDKEFTFPIAIGLINLAEATREDYFRGSGINPEHGPRGVAEWNYLPDSGFGATVSSGLISVDNQWAFQNTFPLELVAGVQYRIEMDFDAATGRLKSTMTADGEPFGPLNDASLDDIFGNPIEGGFTALNVDQIAISSYHDGGQAPPEFAGSVQATGFVDNIEVTLDAPLRITGIQWVEDHFEIAYAGQAGWDYWLEQSSDFSDWITRDHQSVSQDGPSGFALGATLDPQAFFRLRAERQ